MECFKKIGTLEWTCTYCVQMESSLIATVKIIVHVNNMTSKNALHMYISPISETHRATLFYVYL